MSNHKMWLPVFGILAMTAIMLGWRIFQVSTTGIRSHVAVKDGVAVLRPPRGRNAMFAGLALAPVLILMGVLRWVGRGSEDSQARIAMAAALLTGGGWLVVWLLAAEFRQHVRVDAKTIERVFAVTRLQVRWSEVERITWNPRSRWFFIVAAGAWLWVPIDFDGISDFAALALTCLPQPVLLSATDAKEELEVLAHLPRDPDGSGPSGS
jgi:hypothetical protein